MNQKELRPAGLLGFCLLLAACGSGGPSGGPDSDQSLALEKLTPDCFVPHPSNPIIPWSSHFEGSTWNDPSVLYVDGTFIMYLSSDVNLDHNIKIHRLVSDDGINWIHSPDTPVFEKSDTGWDSASVETPSVVYFQGKYHMFYTGYSSSYTDPFDYKIGHAVSDDGVIWTRSGDYLTGPTDPHNSTPTLEFNQWIVAEPGALVYNDRIYLYFSALGANEAVSTTLQVIGWMESVDGVNWSTPSSTLEPDQGLFPRGSGYIGFSTPSAIALGDQVHLFFDVARELSEWTQVQLHHAASGDGVHNWVQDLTPIHLRDDFTWTLSEIRSPAPLLVGSTLYLWYAGHNLGASAGVGLSTCDLSK